MGGRSWTTKEQQSLRELYPFTKNVELAALFHRSVIGIEQMAARLGFSQAKPPKPPVVSKFRNWKEIAANYRPVILGRAV